MSTSKSRVMIAFLAAGMLSGVAMADVTRRAGTNEGDLLNDPYYFRPAPLNPLSLGGAPKIDFNRFAVQSVASAASPSQTSWLGMRIRGAVTSAQSTTQASGVYSAGIRSTLVSWNSVNPQAAAGQSNPTDSLVDGSPAQPADGGYVPPEGNNPDDTIIDLIPPSPPMPAPIPSPASSMLALIGLAIAGAMRRRC